jgi:hypothetical protein
MLALASLIRAFPALVLITTIMPAIAWLCSDTWRNKTIPSLRRIWEKQQGLVKLSIGAASTVIAGIGISSLVYGWSSWQTWWFKVSTLEGGAHSNLECLKMIMSFDPMTIYHYIFCQDPYLDWDTFTTNWAHPPFAFYVVALGFIVLAIRASANLPPFKAALTGLILLPIIFCQTNYYMHSFILLALLGVSDSYIYIILLGLCIAQFATTFITDESLHFYVASEFLLLTYAVILVRLNLQIPRKNTTDDI